MDDADSPAPGTPPLSGLHENAEAPRNIAAAIAESFLRMPFPYADLVPLAALSINTAGDS
jgi:hypothetical protein